MVLIISRCFLFLVNYARMKSEIAIKAIPVLEHVSLSPEIAVNPMLTHTRTWKIRTPLLGP